MHDPLLVRLLERMPHLLEDLGDIAEREQPDALEKIRELLPLRSSITMYGAPVASSTPAVTISTT